VKGLVLDASVAANWLLDEKINAVAQRALDEMQAGTPVFVPTLWLLEIVNVLFSAQRRGRIDRKHRDGALDRIGQLPLAVLAPPGLADLKVLRHYAEKHQLTSYDAEYLRVAKSQNLSLATLDGNLLAGAKREKVAVVSA
jgi:predicted nucleic acid-binding protein